MDDLKNKLKTALDEISSLRKQLVNLEVYKNDKERRSRSRQKVN